MSNPMHWRSSDIKGLLEVPIRDFGSFSMTNLIKFVNEGVPFIKSEAVKYGKIDTSKLAFITPEVHSLLLKSKVTKGDILFTKIGAMGRVALYDGSLGECNSNAATAKIRVDRSKVIPEYVTLLLGSEETFRELEKNIISTPPRINLGDINSLEVRFPPLPQQQKIAKILTTVDNLIEQTQALIDKYTAIKQGMMADLFTRGLDLTGTPETNPNYGQLRPSAEEAPELYKETELGWVPKEWEVRAIKDLSTDGLKNGYFKDPKLVGRGIKLINVSEMYQNFGIDISLQKVERIEASAKDIKKYSVEVGDIFFTRSSLVLEGIAKSNIVRELPEPALFECHVMKLRPNKEIICPEYLALFLETPSARKYLMSMAKQVTMTTIAQPDIVGLKVLLPEMVEQQRVVHEIDAVENHLRKLNNDSEKYKKIKKGLMQDLLTGKVPVNA